MNISDYLPTTVAIIGLVIGLVGAAGAGTSWWRTLRSASTEEANARQRLKGLNLQALAGGGELHMDGDKISIVVAAPSGNDGLNGDGSATTASAQAPVPFERLWNLNEARIAEYHTIATSQSKTSFISSQIATITGFAIILSVGWIAAHANSVVGAVSAGAVGVIGGGLSAYVSSTFMKTQSEASAQLREFFLQPVEFARVLAAERLLEGMEEAERSKARSAMIGAMMGNVLSKKSPDPAG